MNLKFWKKGEKKDLVQYDKQGGVYYLGTGKISAPKLQNYLQAPTLNEAIYSCIGLITQAATEPDWHLYRQQGKNVIEIEDHPLINFMKRPARGMTWDKLIEAYLNYTLLTGNFYTRKMIGTFGQYGQFDLMRPDRVRISANSMGIQRYDYIIEGRVIPIPVEEVIHIKLFNPYDDLYGLSPISSIATQIDIASYSHAWMLSLLEHGGMPAITLSTSGSLTQDQKDFLKEQVKSQVLGYENVMNPLVLEGGLKPEKVSFSPNEIDFMPLSKSTLRKICGVYKVASELLGDSENKTYSNIKEARKALYQEAAFPHLRTFRDEMNNSLVPLFDESGELFLDFDTSNIEALSADKNEEWMRVSGGINAGVITRNEGREILDFGKSKEKGADVLTVQSTIVPLEMMAGEPEEEEPEKPPKKKPDEEEPEDAE